ncbi:cadmium resistance transporter [Paraburkholderia unamae]|uniref:cadmium resistance transporter n=1 Tax=Paraburkholderia unamae TaxID=219649 RepID=UPI0011BD8BE7|nr:cadmium resistance transporter [Paraburkholderia unamae]
MTAWSVPAVTAGMTLSILLAFVTSSIDDFVLLVCLYAERRVPAREVTVAKLACAALSLGLALACARACLALPLPVSRAVGLVPLALGIKRLAERRSAPQGVRAEPEPERSGAHAERAVRRFARCLFILLAASLDNIALYIPLFAQGSHGEAALAWAVVMPMTLLLCTAALVSSRLRVPLRARRLRLDAVVPYLMIYIGIKALAASLL